jgi:uncharacterized membrane protein YkvA (DUF1232 family)
MLDRWRTMTRRLKRKTYALYLARHDPRVPPLAKVIAFGVLAYAFSPIDLIPDFVPILGLVDDLILVPLGLYLVLRLIPPEVVSEYEAKADTVFSRPTNWLAAGVIVAIWLCLAGLGIVLAWKLFTRQG